MFPNVVVGSLQIPSYFLVISLTCCLCMVWLWRRALSQGKRASFALDLSLIVFLSGFVGARLLHVIWENPIFYMSEPLQILNLFAGGYVFLGGALTATLAAFIYCRRHNELFLSWADLAAPVGALGYAVGRLSCFLQGCCYGKACQLPWSVTFPVHSEWGLEALSRHPTQLYAALLEVTIGFALLWRERRPHRVGDIFLTWVIMHSTARVFLEIFRDDQRGFQPLGLSLSTWISLTLILVTVKYRETLKKPERA